MSIDEETKKLSGAQRSVQSKRHNFQKDQRLALVDGESAQEARLTHEIMYGTEEKGV